MSALRDRVQAALGQQRLSLRQLAARLGCSHTALSFAMSNRSGEVSGVLARVEDWLRKVEARPHAASAAALAAYRAEHGLSPTQLAARLGVSASTVYKLETGRHAPRRAVRDRMLAELGLSLFGEPTA